MRIFLITAALVVTLLTFGSSKPAGDSLDAAEFEEKIADGVVLVDFWAPWCGPCKAQNPILEDVAKQVKDFASVKKVNVDEQSDLAQKFGISSIPTLIIFKDGEERKRFQGLTDADDILMALKAEK